LLDNDYVFDGPRDRPPTEPGSVYYDVKVYSQNHLRAYYQLASFSEQISDFVTALFQCFPLVKSLSPGYIMIDTEILCLNILNMTGRQFSALIVRTERNKMAQWRRVVNLDVDCFKKQGDNDGNDRTRLKFRGCYIYRRCGDLNIKNKHGRYCPRK
jgi:alkylated DNA nucleotide flippase Atl1